MSPRVADQALCAGEMHETYLYCVRCFRDARLVDRRISSSGIGHKRTPADVIERRRAEASR